MTNEVLFIITTVVSFSMVVISHRLFGKTGMFIWMALATVIANIEVVKCIDMFGMATALGNVIYGSTFLSTDILSEMHGEKDARKSVYIGFFAMICSTALFQFSLLFIPNSSDFASPAMQTIFELTPRFTIVSIICFLISNRLDVFLYQWFGKRTRKLWVKNNCATLIAQFIDTVLYTFLAFTGVFTLRVMIEIIITSYIMKAIVAALDTPFLYFARALNRSKKGGEVC